MYYLEKYFKTTHIVFLYMSDIINNFRLQNVTTSFYQIYLKKYYYGYRELSGIILTGHYNPPQ